jgi:hypothetical protein
METSLAVDSNNKVHISYRDLTNYDLKYTTNATGGWVLTTVDSAGEVGNYTSIAVDSSDKVHISYYDSTNNDLKYATNAVIDTTPPVGSIIIDNEAIYTNTLSVTLALSCADLQGTCTDMQFSNDGSGWSVAETFATSRIWTLPSGEGFKTVYARFKDSNNNWSSSYSDTITLDMTAPSPPAVTGSTPTNDPRPAWSWISGAGDGNGTYRYKLDDSDLTTGAIQTTSTSYAPITPLTEGVHTLYVQERDNASNWSASGSFAILIDTTPPDPPTVNGTTPTKNVRPTWTWSSGGGGGNGTFRYKLDDSDLSNGATETSSTGYTPGSDLPDGLHTLYVQERDTAGSWSGSGSFSILVDTIAPTGTVTINTGDAYTDTTLVTLDITASDLNGISEMQFSNDGSNWSTPEPFNAAVLWTLLTVDGIKTVSVKVKDPADNWSAPFSDDIILDETPPVTSASPPGTDIGNPYQSAQTVTLGCDDLGGSSGNSCANTYYCTGPIGSGCNPTTPYTYSPPIEFQLSSNTEIRYYSEDILGNSESEPAGAGINTDTYYFAQAVTTLSMSLSAPRILSGDSVDAVGQLLRVPEDGASRNGLTIRFEITGPAPLPPPTETTTYTDSGLYSHTISGLVTEGTYTIKAVFDGTGLLMNSESTEMNVYVGPSAGYAIILEGRIPGDFGRNSHNKTTNRIYKKLKNRGFTDSDIYYFNYNMSQPGIEVDAVPTKAAVQNAIEGWAANKMTDIEAPLYLIMNDHGDPGDGFYIYSDNGLDDDYITPDNLNGWLNNMEQAVLDAGKALKERVVIIGACYSGVYIPVLSEAGRTIITSAAGDEVSYMGPYEDDDIRSGEFFLEELFTFLERGDTVTEA